MNTIRKASLRVLATMAVLVLVAAGVEAAGRGTASANGNGEITYGGPIKTKINAQLNLPNEHEIVATTQGSDTGPLLGLTILPAAVPGQGSLIVNTLDTAIWKAPTKTAAETWVFQTKATGSSSAAVYLNNQIRPLQTGAQLTVKFIGGATRPTIYLKLTGQAPTGVGTTKASIEAETVGSGALRKIVITAVVPSESSVVGTGTNIVIKFDKPLGGFNPAGLVVDCGNGPIAFTYLLVGDTLTITPTIPLPPGSVCTVTVPKDAPSDTTPADGPGGLVTDFTYNFETDKAPEVESVSPDTDGDVPTNQAFTITFDEPVDIAAGAIFFSCLPSYLSGPDSDSTEATNVTEYVVSGPWPEGETCTVIVYANKVTDSDTADAPDQMVEDYTFSFTVDAAPHVVNAAPAEGSTVGLIPTFLITFNEPVSITATTLPLSCSLSGIALGGTIGSFGTNYLLVTTASVVPGDLCQLTIPAGVVHDVDSVDPFDTMVDDFVLNYTVDVAPTVVSTTASPSGTVVKNTQVTVSWNMSEPVDVAITFRIQCGGGFPSFVPLIQSNTTAISLTFTKNSATTCNVSVVGLVTDSDLADPPGTILPSTMGTIQVVFTN